MLILKDVDSYKVAQVINQSWTEAEDLVISSAGGRNIQHIQKASSSRTGGRWLSKLGFKWKEVSKGVYRDSHEREDMIAYWMVVFLPTMRLLSTRLMVWDHELEPQPTIQVLNGEEQAVIIVTHDECTFNANDGRRFIWTHEEHNPIRKKGIGQGLHVSELLTPVGRLGGGSACEILKCGGNVWWDGANLLNQITTKGIPTFEAEFPGCQALFMFDNAKNHSKYAVDALRVCKMNLKMVERMQSQ